MAPPSKRRRLSFWPADDTSHEQEINKGINEHKHGFTHTVTQLENANGRLPSVEEVHIHIHEQPTSDHEQWPQNIVARQAVNVDAGAISSVGVTLPSDSIASSTSDSNVAVTASTTASLAPSTISADTTSLTPPAASSSILVSTQPTDSILSTVSLSPTSNGISYSSSGLLTTIGSTTTSLPVITSSPSLISSSLITSKNTTVAENILTTGLNITFSGAASRSGSIIPSFYSNSSYRYSLSSTSTGSLTSSSSYSSSSSSSAAAADGGGVVTSVYLTTATISRDGQAVSTITTAVGAQGYNAPAPPTTTDATVAKNGGSSAPDPPTPGTIAGGVVGGAAGLAVLLLMAMLLLRWYRRRSRVGHQGLLADSAGAYHDSDHAVSRDGPGMAERAGMRPWVAALPALMRHHAPSSDTSSATGAIQHETGFQRVSGRKLPSAWSPGMESSPTPIPTAADGYRGSGRRPFILTAFRI